MQIPPGSASAFQACRNINAIAKDVVVLDDDVAEIDPDPEPDPAFLGDRGCAIGHRELPFGRTAHRVYDAREFRQYPVASGVDDAAGVLVDLRVDDFASMRLQAFVRAFLVRAHIGGEDRGETADSGHQSPGAKVLRSIYPKIVPDPSHGQPRGPTICSTGLFARGGSRRLGRDLTAQS